MSGAKLSPLQRRILHVLANCEPPWVLTGGAALAVDSRQEILVNKLCALLSRCELRDLEDVKALLDAGADLERALTDAPRKDQGFSSLTLAWVLRQLQPRTLAQAMSWSAQETEALERFHAWLVDRLVAAGAPE